MAAYDPELVYREVDHPFVECSTFADDIKYHGGAWQSDFHFEDNVWNEDDGDYNIQYHPHNMTYAIFNLVQWLSPADDGDDYKQSYIYDYIQNRLYPGNEDVAQSYALRLLIHYIGDMHQPLHNEALYNETYPTGDKGGNLVPLKYHYDVDELHALFDKVMYTQYHSIARPIDEEHWAAFMVETAGIALNGTDAVADPSVYDNFDVKMWSDNSYAIAITLYEGITPDGPVPQEYLNEKLVMCQNQITIGGYRLAHIIEYVFPERANTMFLQ